MSSSGTKTDSPNISYLYYFLLFLVLFVTGCTKDLTESERKEALMLAMISDINADTLRSYVNWLENMETRFSLADNHRSIAVRIRNRLRGMGYADARLDSFIVRKNYRNIDYEQWQYNVIAKIEGTEYPDSLCILGGHYDNNVIDDDPFIAAPGANDNASGTAALLEVARVMKKHGFSPRSTIMFAAFGAEEIGLFGSNRLASAPFEYYRKIRFMLNNDMVAFTGSTEPAQWVVNILDYDNSHGLRSEAERLCTKYSTIGFMNDNKFNKYSDSYPFFLNGYKALFFFSAVSDPSLHTMNDVSAGCNFEYCREVVRISCALLSDKN